MYDRPTGHGLCPDRGHSAILCLPADTLQNAVIVVFLTAAEIKQNIHIFSNSLVNQKPHRPLNGSLYSFKILFY